MGLNRIAKPEIGVWYRGLYTQDFSVVAFDEASGMSEIQRCRCGLVQADFGQAGSEVVPGGPDIGIQTDRKPDKSGGEPHPFLNFGWNFRGSAASRRAEKGVMKSETDGEMTYAGLLEMPHQGVGPGGIAYVEGQYSTGSESRIGKRGKPLMVGVARQSRVGYRKALLGESCGDEPSVFAVAVHPYFERSEILVNPLGA